MSEKTQIIKWLRKQAKIAKQSNPFDPEVTSLRLRANQLSNGSWKK